MAFKYSNVPSIPKNIPAEPSNQSLFAKKHLHHGVLLNILIIQGPEILTAFISIFTAKS